MNGNRGEKFQCLRVHRRFWENSSQSGNRNGDTIRVRVRISLKLFKSFLFLFC